MTWFTVFNKLASPLSLLKLLLASLELFASSPTPPFLCLPCTQLVGSGVRRLTRIPPPPATLRALLPLVASFREEGESCGFWLKAEGFSYLAEVTEACNGYNGYPSEGRRGFGIR
jgi:hypothetical protein